MMQLLNNMFNRVWYLSGLAGLTIGTMDSMRLAEVQQVGRRLGLQRYGRIHAPVLFLVPKEVSGLGSH